MLRFYEEKKLIASIRRRGCTDSSIPVCWGGWR
jgi:hypothetical protein